MKTIQFFLLFAFFISIKTQAQKNTVPNEFILYMSDGTTPATVSDIANTWQSNVLVNVQQGTNIAVLEFVGTFPFQNPYNSNEMIRNLVGIVGKIKKHEPEGDGGSLNRFLNKTINGYLGGNCYNQDLLKGDLGTSSIVRTSVFDTGTNWELANQNGFNFGTSYEINGDATDLNGHGTHVASIINKTYVNSTNTNILLPIEYSFGNPLNSDGTGTLADVVLSMEQAIIHGTNVINCSFSYMAPTMSLGPQSNPSSQGNSSASGSGLQPTIQPAMEEDPLYLLMTSADPLSTLFVVSAGNDNGKDLDALCPLNVYPAAFPLENMITVASHDCLHNISNFSNLGQISVDLAAPGENIVSIDHQMNLVSYSGTSQSAAYVSGCASILGTHLPTFNASEIKCAIMNTTQYAAGLQGKMVTEGIIDIQAAIDFLNDDGCSTSLSRNRQESLLEELSIHPIPYVSDLNIHFALHKESSVNISILSLNGMPVRHYVFDGTKGANEISLNLDNLPIQPPLLLTIRTNEFYKTSKITRIP